MTHQPPTPSTLARTHGVQELSPAEAADRHATDEVVLLDVREPREWELCRIDGAAPAPLSRFMHHLPDLDPDRPTVVYCHTGVRSVYAAAFLQQQGFAEVYSMAGGIDAWSTQVDPAVPRYQ